MSILISHSKTTPYTGAIAGNVDKGLGLNSRAFGQIAQADLPAGQTPTLISKQVLGSSAASISFSSIPQIYSHLMLIGQARCDGAVTLANNILRVGSANVIDTGINYDTQIMNSTGVVFTVSELFNLGFVYNGNIPGTLATASSGGVFVTIIYNYTNTTWSKNIDTTYGVTWGTTNGLHRVAAISGLWRSTAAINILSLAIDTGANYITGTTVELVGIP